MKQPYYEDYHTMSNKRKISIKLNPDERALLQLDMSQEGWSNVSGYIKYRLFGFDKTNAKKNALILKKDKDGIVTLLNNYLKSFVDYTGFAITAFKKELAKLAASQPWEDAETIKKRINVVRKWVHTVDKKMNSVLLLLIKTSDSLGLPTTQYLKETLGRSTLWEKNQKPNYRFGMQCLLLTGKVTKVFSPFRLSDPNNTECIRFILDTEKDKEGTNLAKFTCVTKLPSFEIKKGDTLMAEGTLQISLPEDSQKKPLTAYVYCRLVDKYEKKEGSNSVAKSE